MRFSQSIDTIKNVKAIPKQYNGDFVSPFFSTKSTITNAAHSQKLKINSAGLKLTITDTKWKNCKYMRLYKKTMRNSLE